MFSIKTLMKSFSYALEGILIAVKIDQNVRLHLVIGLAVVVLSFYLRITRVEFLIVFFAIFFVIITEMINTAIEEMTNLITKEHRREAKVAKDVAAASVLLASIFGLTVGLVVFPPYIF